MKTNKIENKLKRLQSLPEYSWIKTIYLWTDFKSNEIFRMTIRDAFILWHQRVEEYVEDHGANFTGSCVSGAGIQIYALPSAKHKKPRPMTILAAPDHYQGSMSWEHSKDEIVNLLKKAGIECFYNCGSMH